MQRFFLITAAAIVIIIFALQGFRPSYKLPEGQDITQQVAYEGDGDPAQALVDIYFNVDMLGLQDATKENLEEDLDLDPTLYSDVYGKYTDGRFGIADVLIIQPWPGQEDAVREALEQVKLDRMDFFRNFDVYNAYQLAADGVIFQRGNYYILMMIDNSDQVRSILEQYLPR